MWDIRFFPKGGGGGSDIFCQEPGLLSSWLKYMIPSNRIFLNLIPGGLLIMDNISLIPTVINLNSVQHGASVADICGMGTVNSHPEKFSECLQCICCTHQC